MANKKSLGISLFGFLVILFSIMSFFSALFGVFIFEGKLTVNQRITLLIISLLSLGLGVGILKLKEWARKIILLLSIYYILSYLIKNIIPLILSKDSDWVRYLYSLFILSVFTSPLIYFTNPRVKGQFKLKK